MNNSRLKLTRREFVAGTAVLTLSLATASTIAGCDASPDPDDAASVGETRVVMGIDEVEVEVPANPQRVVTLSEPTLDGALALGVMPIGCTTGRGQSTVSNYLKDQAGDLPLVGSISTPNYEVIATLKPDLLLSDGTGIDNDEDIVSILSEIAPFVYTGYSGGHWERNFGNIANALNRQEEGERVVEDYYAFADEAKSQLEAYADNTFSIVRWQGNSAALILKELPSGMAINDAGLKRPPAQDKDGPGHSYPVSLENLSEIDADYMFFGTLGGSSVQNPNAGGSAAIDGAKRALEEAVKVPGFTDLKAYRDKHIILVDGSMWLSTGGPQLMRNVVASILEALL